MSFPQLLGIKKELHAPFDHPNKDGRDDRIRTCGLLVPNQARYQTALRPEQSTS